MPNLGRLGLSAACALKMLFEDDTLRFRLTSAGRQHVRLRSVPIAHICQRVEFLGEPMLPLIDDTLEFEPAERYG